MPGEPTVPLVLPLTPVHMQLVIVIQRIVADAFGCLRMQIGRPEGRHRWDQLHEHLRERCHYYNRENFANIDLIYDETIWSPLDESSHGRIFRVHIQPDLFTAATWIVEVDLRKSLHSCTRFITSEGSAPFDPFHVFFDEELDPRASIQTSPESMEIGE